MLLQVYSGQQFAVEHFERSAVEHSAVLAVTVFPVQAPVSEVLLLLVF